MGGVEVGLSLSHPGLEDLGIDQRNHLALADDGVEIDVELFDLARDLAADQNRDHGVDGAARRDRRGEGPALHPREPVLRGVAAALRVEIAPNPRPDGDRDEDKRQQPWSSRGASHTAFPPRRSGAVLTACSGSHATGDCQVVGGPQTVGVARPLRCRVASRAGRASPPPGHARVASRRWRISPARP